MLACLFRLSSLLSLEAVIVRRHLHPKIPQPKTGSENKLRALARALGRLASKAAAVIPGIIGSIIAGILNFLKKPVVAASEHVWLFLTSIATLIGYRLLYPSQSKKC